MPASKRPVENGSVMGPLGTVADYAIQLIKKIQNEDLHSLVPRQDITDAYNRHVQEWVKHTVWKEECRSWYKNNDTGRVNAIWPGSSMHYQEVIDTPRYEDMEIRRNDKGNPWAFLGMGYAMANKIEGSDWSPYISVDAMDPQWVEAALDVKKQDG